MYSVVQKRSCGSRLDDEMHGRQQVLEPGLVLGPERVCKPGLAEVHSACACMSAMLSVIFHVTPRPTSEVMSMKLQIPCTVDVGAWPS